MYLSSPRIRRIAHPQATILVIDDATKVRVADRLLSRIDEDHIIYPGGVNGDSARALLEVCRAHKKCTTLVFNARENTPENQNQIAAYRHEGASIVFVNGNDQDAFDAAQTHAANSDGKVISFADDTAISIIADSLIHPLTDAPRITHAFVAAARGGFYNGVRAGVDHANNRQPSLSRGPFASVEMHISRIVNLGYDFQNAVVHDHPFPDDLRFDPPFPCNAEYEARAWRQLMHMLETQKIPSNSVVLFYNGSAPLATMRLDTGFTGPVIAA